MYVHNYERNWKNSGCIRVDNFFEYVDFKGVFTNKTFKTI